MSSQGPSADYLIRTCVGKLNNILDVWYSEGKMRDISSLFYEYERALDFIEKLDAVVEAMERGSPSSVAWRDLSPLLRALTDLLDPLHEEAVGSPEMMMVPVGLARRLRGKRFEGVGTTDVLRELLGRGEAIGERDVGVLREVRDDARREASAIQRQLLRR